MATVISVIISLIALAALLFALVAFGMAVSKAFRSQPVRDSLIGGGFFVVVFFLAGSCAAIIAPEEQSEQAQDNPPQSENSQQDRAGEKTQTESETVSLLYEVVDEREEQSDAGEAVYLDVITDSVAENELLPIARGVAEEYGDYDAVWMRVFAPNPEAPLRDSGRLRMDVDYTPEYTGEVLANFTLSRSDVGEAMTGIAAGDYEFEIQNRLAERVKPEPDSEVSGAAPEGPSLDITRAEWTGEQAEVEGEFNGELAELSCDLREGDDQNVTDWWDRKQEPEISGESFTQVFAEAGDREIQDPLKPRTNYYVECLGVFESDGETISDITSIQGSPAG